jgi:hypothetical protein
MENSVKRPLNWTTAWTTALGVCAITLAAHGFAATPLAAHGFAATPVKHIRIGALDSLVASTYRTQPIKGAMESGFQTAVRPMNLGAHTPMVEANPALDDSSGIHHDALPQRNSASPEALVRRVHNEGLPLARLWENHAVLISLGVNPKGKVGLWLIQKVP